MKRVVFFNLVVGLLITTVCSGQSVITMTTESGGVMISIAGTGTVTIDWGDGSPNKTYTLSKYNEKDWYIATRSDASHFSAYDGKVHVYYNYYSDNSDIISSHTIVITGGNITHLSCKRNKLTSLDLGETTTLIELLCDANQLTSLDVSKNKALVNLNCNVNRLSNLDVSKNTELVYFYCSYNQISSLCLNNNTKLKEVFCSNNQLTSLDFSKNTALKNISCMNEFNGYALNNMFKTLHGNSGKKDIMIKDVPGKGSYDKRIAKKKGWKVIVR